MVKDASIFQLGIVDTFVWLVVGNYQLLDIVENHCVPNNVVLGYWIVLKHTISTYFADFLQQSHIFCGMLGAV